MLREKLMRRVLRAIATALEIGSMIGGMIWWLWALAIWAAMYGLVGVLIGLLTIPDLALPFLVHAEEGAWPRAWILAGIVLLLMPLVGAVFGGAAEALEGRAANRAVQHSG
jgi:hypothetical protein